MEPCEDLDAHCLHLMWLRHPNTYWIDDGPFSDKLEAHDGTLHMHAIKSPSGLMQPYEDVEDTLPWILNDVVDFEGCFKRKIIKIHKVDHWGGKKE